MSEAHRFHASGEPAIPDKLYFRIGEIARLLEVETHTLRFWETEFPQLKIGKGGTGQRLYRRRDVELLLEIKHLLYEQGFTIPGARQFLQNRVRRKDATQSAAGATPPPSLERIREELRDLSALLSDKDAPAEAAGAPRGPRPVRRGLHLAARTPAKSRPTPTLFDSHSGDTQS